MSSGSFQSDVPGRYFLSTWNGTNDPLHKAENAYTKTQRHRTGVFCRFTAIPNGSLRAEGYYGPGHEDHLPQYPSSMDLELLSKASSDIRGHDFNAAIAGAEGPKTLTMITDTAKTFYNAWRQAKRGDWEGVYRSFGRVVQGGGKTRKSGSQQLNPHDLSDAWLALQYGWLPLLKDVYEGAQFIHKKWGPPRLIRNRYTRTTVVPQWDDSAPGWPEKVYCKVILSKEIRIYWTESVSTARELGLLDPASVAWELIPFSFVMDWFIPIGTYLDVLSVIPNLGNAEAASTLVKYAIGEPWHPPPCKFYKYPDELRYPHKSFGCCWNAIQQPNTILTSSGSAIYHHKTIVRTVKGPITVPKPSFKTIEAALSLGHLKNAAALIHSITRR